MKLAGRFDPEALRILREVPGILVEPRPRAGSRRAGAVLRFAGGSAPVAVEVKRRASAATAWQLVQRARGLRDGHLLLVAGETTADARAILERHGVAVIDGLGNAHLELPGLLLHLEGQRRARGRRGDASSPRPPTRLRGKAGVAAQALLLAPDREWRVQDLAAEARTSIGLAHRVLARLEADGLVAAEGAGPRRIRRVTDRAALLDLFAEENKDRAVQRLRAYRLAREPHELAAAASGGLAAAGIDHAVTGAGAAARIAPLVTTVPVAEIWVTSVALPDDVIAAAGAEAVDSGHNLVFAQTPGDEPLAFRHEVDGLWTVNPVRLYADLRHDPRRGREQAEHLRREVIGS